MRESPETIGDAILLYVRKHYGSQSAAAIAWHCSPAMLSEVVRGTRRPTERMLSAIGYCHVEVWMPVSDRLPDSALPLNAGGVRACGSHECIAGQRDGVICANGECDRVNGVRPDGVLPSDGGKGV